MEKALQIKGFAFEQAIQFDVTGGAELVTAEEEIEAWTAQVKALTQSS